MARATMKMMAWRYLPLLVGVFVLTTAAAFTANAANSNNGRAGVAEQPSSTELEGGWHFVRTRNPQGGPDAISIMRTADTSRSDLELAGLMIRCSEGGTEVVVVLLRPFPARARPHVVFGKAGNQTQFEAKVVAPGTAVLIPGDATSLVGGPWQGLNDLFIRVEDGQATIRGVVALASLQPAFKVLTASCPAP
jgi:hypothetical protein